MPTRRFALAALAAIAASGCASPPLAHATGRLVDMQIVERSRGQTLQTWRAQGFDWVAGRPGDRYAVRLSNRTGQRVLVVLSVDGVNAVSGETAATGQTGYVLDPWQTTEITGWRKSWQEAAAFYFTSLPDSYAARTDRPDHVGVIGAAVFRERAPIAWHRPPSSPPVAKGRNDGDPGAFGSSADGAERRPESSALAGAARDRAAQAPSPSADASPREQQAMRAKPDSKLGTGHGEREYSPTTQTAFERASSSPNEVVQIRYDSHANLVAAGIVRQRRPAPEPFPGFAPDPRG